MGRPAALVDSDWHEQAVNMIEQIARRQPEVTNEDLRREFDAPENANAYGRVFTRAAELNIIRWKGYRKSRDKSRKGGVISVWELHPSQRDADV